MKKTLTFFVMFCLALATFGQVNEGNPQKGLSMNNPAAPAIDAYQTLSTLYLTASDDGLWEAENWHAGTANSGTWYATGTYNGNTPYRLEGPDIELPQLTGDAERYNLYIEEQYQFESYYDQGLVMISTDRGQTWQTVSSRTGQSALRTSVVNLTPWAGKSIRLAFSIEADATNNYRGWSISSIGLKHEMLKSAATEPLLKAASSSSLNGNLNSLDAQKFPRFIFANMNVYDNSGNPVKGLDESNFSVTEEIQSVTKNVDKDATFKIFSSEDTTTKRPVDILFLMDNSGSMYDNQQAVKNNVEAFVDSLGGSGLSFRLGLCRFGQSQNLGKPIFHNNGAWYTDVTTFKTVWSTANVASGSREPSWDALYYAVDSLSFRSAAQKVFILITDETITGNNINYSEITDRQVVIDQLKGGGITTYTLTESGSTFDSDFGVIARSNGGKWYDIDGSFTTILNDISTQVGSTYTLRYTPTDMDMDGHERRVTITVDYNSEQLPLQGTYVPGMSPIVIRTDTTLTLNESAQPENTSVLIEVLAKDYVYPFTQSASLFYRLVGSTDPYTKLSMSSTQAGSSESIWQATIPGVNVKRYGIEYYVQATDGSNTTTAPEFLDQEGYPWSFAVIPNEAPVVTNQTDASSITEGDVIPFRVEAIDNTDNVAKVLVYVFRENQDITFQPYQMTSLGSNIYGYDGMTLDDGTTEYFFVAEDNYGVSTFEGDELSPFVIVDSPWDITTSARRHTIYLNKTNWSLPYVEGIVPGDVIGVFYNKITYDAQGNPIITQECGGSGVYSGKPGTSIFANADNTLTTEKDGFADGEAFSFKVLKKETGNILSIEHSFSSGSPNTTFAVRGRSFLDTLRVVAQTQQMVLKKGINLWSTYLIPEETDFDDMMASYLSSVTEIYDDELHVWKHNNSSSTLTSYKTGYGYELYTNGEAIIRITGRKPDIGSVSVDIKGNQAGTLVGCHYDVSENVEAAFSQVASNIYSVDKYINDGTGQATIESYSPKYGFNGWTDKNMNPGEAYYVYADNAIQDFHFPAATGIYGSKSSSLKNAKAYLLPQKVVSVVHYMHVLLPSTAWATTPQTGDEVRVYNQSGILVGQATIQANGAMVILDGMKIQQDETFSLRLWSADTEREQPISIGQWLLGSGQYDNLKTAVAKSIGVDQKADLLSGSISVSPNPATNQVTVAFRLEEASTVRLSLINMQGKTVRTPATSEYSKGANAVPVDVSGLEKGIYFLKIQAGEAAETVKLVIE
jgi:hypothetical protein